MGSPHRARPWPKQRIKFRRVSNSFRFNPIGVKAAIEMCGTDRVIFGTDFGPVPYGIKEHIDLVETVVPDAEGRERVFWKTSDARFNLGLPG